MHSFRSDNNAGLCPEALDAIVAANDGSHHIGYGDDPYTEAATAAIRDLFGVDCTVAFVATGTAANTLAVAALTRPWQQVICHVHSHWHDDESTAPERLTGCRTFAIQTDAGKLTVDEVAATVARTRGDVHQPQAGVVTISNPTEFGMVYEPDEVAAICRVAHDAGYRVHVDAARFANAVAALGCPPAALAAEAGVDAMSFGGTKNGLAAGEAIVLFRQGNGRVHDDAAASLPFLRKSTGHLLSKQRFVTAPFAATLRDGIWLRHAAHANGKAAELAAGLADRGLETRYPCQVNSVFLTLPDAVDEAILAAGHGYYRFGEASWRLARLMCSFDTTADDVSGLLSRVDSALAV